ncbi:MAG: hypothetical protein LBH19_10095 [Dysgonamonadaceae bacterium]|jgi:hypothetical protein|nr:hypothetical protein [Dysgonamonadaceae bacterium]
MNNLKIVKYLISGLISLSVAGIFSSCDDKSNGETGTGTVTVSTRKLVFGREESALRFTVTANVGYTIEKVGDWIRPDRYKGAASPEPETVRIGVDELTGNSDRKGLILVKAAGKTDTIAVRQYAASLTANFDTIFLNDTDETVKKTIRVKSTHRWTAKADSWISLSKRTAAANTTTSVEASVGINNEPDERTGKIEFQSIVGEDSDTLCATVFVKQSKGDFFGIDKPEIELSDLGKYKKITLTTSREWSLTSDAAWLHIDNTSGNAGKSTIQITGDERDDAETSNRVGEITVTMGQQTKKITVTQGVKGAYYDNNYVLQVHSHTVGDGVVIVGIGDGFDRSELKKGGYYETHIKELLLDKILDCQVFRDFKDYFDVYIYMAESTESGVTAQTKNAFDSGKSYGPSFDKAVSAINNHPVFKDAGRKCPDNIAIVFAGNGMIGGYAYFHIRAGIYSFAEGPNYYWAAHEFGGHGFAGLADEYASDCNYMGGPSGLKDMQDKGNGTCLNVSWTTDTDLYWKVDGGTTKNIDESNGNPCVPWKQFINHPQYTGKNAVGFHLGGFYCPSDIWKPEPVANSVMVTWNGGKGTYNAQSRWIIYKKIHDLANMPYSFDDFVDYDRRNLLP